MTKEEEFELLIHSTDGIKLDVFLEKSSQELRLLLDQVRSTTVKKKMVDIYWLTGFLQGVLAEREKLTRAISASKCEVVLSGPSPRSRKCSCCDKEIDEIN
jgi:hypothetical protein